MKDPESRYKMGWLLVVFDMPVMTKQERRLATRFRQDLLGMGYLMLQYSVYARCTVTLERKQRLINELKQIAPDSGSIQCLYITDAQWGQTAVIHAANKKSKYDAKGQAQIGEQLQFWD